MLRPSLHMLIVSSLLAALGVSMFGSVALMNPSDSVAAATCSCPHCGKRTGSNLVASSIAAQCCCCRKTAPAVKPQAARQRDCCRKAASAAVRSCCQNRATQSADQPGVQLATCQCGQKQAPPAQLPNSRSLVQRVLEQVLAIQQPSLAQACSLPKCEAEFHASDLSFSAIDARFSQCVLGVWRI